MRELTIKRFCQEVPKIELHAHLHGSASFKTLLELAKLDHHDSSSIERDIRKISESLDLSLEGCFALFPVIHRLIRNNYLLARLTAAVIRDFARDNVIYLELRSTPKLLQDGTSELEYIRTVISTIGAEEKMHWQ